MKASSPRKVPSDDQRSRRKPVVVRTVRHPPARVQLDPSFGKVSVPRVGSTPSSSEQKGTLCPLERGARRCRRARSLSITRTAPERVPLLGVHLIIGWTGLSRRALEAAACGSLALEGTPLRRNSRPGLRGRWSPPTESRAVDAVAVPQPFDDRIGGLDRQEI